MKKTPIGFTCIYSTTFSMEWTYTNTSLGSFQLLKKLQYKSDSAANRIPNLIKLEPNTLTTNNFDSTFNNKISTYTTDKTFSWIVTQPLKTDYTSYFISEIVTQFFIGALLTLLLVLTKNHKIQTQMMFIGIVGLVAWAATYGQLLNWWAMQPLMLLVSV